MADGATDGSGATRVFVELAEDATTGSRPVRVTVRGTGVTASCHVNLHAPPAFDVPPTPPLGSIVQASVGQLLAFQVSATDPDLGDEVSLGGVGIPLGASFSPPEPGPTVSAFFSWTPQSGQEGDHVVFFSARDKLGLSAPPHSVIVRVTKPQNHPPEAHAGPDQTMECTGVETSVSLDGSLSFDVDGDPLTFTWGGPFGTAGGEQVTVGLEVGRHDITLTVDDGHGASDVDDVAVRVMDSQAPTIGAVRASPGTLWPPNNKMVPVYIVGVESVTDRCGHASCRITSVSSNESGKSKGGGYRGADWEIVDDLVVMLRATRSGRGAGRTYTITIECSDTQGNTATKKVTVTVPHDQGRPKNGKGKRGR